MEAIEIDYKVSGTRIFIPFKAICSVTDKEFGGNVIIEYHPNSKVLEYVDTEMVVTELTKVKLKAEELARRVFDEVAKSIEPNYLKITVDVDHSDAHQPVQVWIEEELK